MASNTQKQDEILRELKKLPDDTMDEILDFVKFLKIRDSDSADAYIESESPLEEDWSEQEEEKAWQDL